jgi:hypothetical protein
VADTVCCQPRVFRVCAFALSPRSLARIPKWPKIRLRMKTKYVDNRLRIRMNLAMDLDFQMVNWRL